MQISVALVSQGNLSGVLSLQVKGLLQLAALSVQRNRGFVLLDGADC